MRMPVYHIKNWDQITKVETQPWGGKSCRLTTIDGYVINIFEWYHWKENI